HIARVIPALCRIFEQVDRAHAKRRTGHRDVGRNDRIRNEADLFEWSPRLNRSGSWLRIVDQVRALQVEAARTEVADLNHRARSDTLFDRRAPLLDVLRRRMRLHPG